MGAQLDALMKDINSKEKEVIFTQGLPSYEYTRIPFTSPRMNYCTYGGIPVGKITEFYGEEHGGKTTTALDIVANFQNMFPDKAVLYVDAENTLDADWARKIGVDLEHIYLVQPQSQSAEDLFKIITEAMDSSELGLWVLDSIGALQSSQALEKDIDEATYGGVSKPLTKFGSIAVMKMHKYNCTGIAINQVRDNMNSTWGGLKTPGGHAWKHYCAVRMEFRKGRFIDENGKELNQNAANPAGNIVIMSMTKNKTCKPDRRTGQYTLNYEEGIDYFKDLVEVAIEYEIIDKHGSWFTIIDTDTGEILKDKIQGQAGLYKFLDENSEILEKVEELVNKKLM